MSEKRREFESAAFRYLDPLLRTAVYMTGNRDDADDLVQETFRRAYLDWNRRDETTNYRTRIFTILVAQITRHRRAIHATGVPDRLRPSIEGDVRDAILSLPPDLRLVVVLSFLERFSYGNIVLITGLDIAKIKSLLREGRQTMQSSLHMKPLYRRLKKANAA